MFGEQVFDVDLLCLLEAGCVEEALEERPMFVPHNPLLINSGLDLAKLVARPGVKSKAEEVIPIHNKVTNKETFSDSYQVENAYNLVDFSGNLWADRT